MSKKMRLPNGFGQISKINNARIRRPYRAMVTVGRREDGRPICRLLKPQSYFYTYNEAFAALVEYNKNPFDLDGEMSLGDLYEKWSNMYFQEVGLSRKQAVNAAWRYSRIISHMRVRDIRARHIKGVLDEGCINIAGKTRYPSSHVKIQIKTMFNLMLDYALEYELVEKNYARTFNIPKEVLKKTQTERKSHNVFTDEEMEKLWHNTNNPYVAAILVQCYMGWRPGEMATIKIEDVDLKRRCIRGGLKTEAGINRIVPIHSRVLPLVRMLYTIAGNYNSNTLLVEVSTKSSYIYNKNQKMNYRIYAREFKAICRRLGIEGHLPHDPRKQFITMAKRAGVDEYVIKRLVGHAIYDITESTYTDRDLDWMAGELEKIR